MYKSFNSKNYQLHFFIDLRKAFDTVSNLILLAKLEKYGVRGISLNVINSVFMRSHTICTNEKTSSLKDINIGCSKLVT